jgi:4-amino-4-deoxy-L-arabinose transferase-like glycosyltransferase
VGFLLLAWGLRLPPLLQSPLHPDEALYGYWGLLIGRGRDLWLAGAPVDKPPLLPYVIAISQLVLGSTNIALRLPGAMAGLLAVPLVGRLAHALYREPWTAVCATVAAALSPFAVTFSGTAFTDPLMVTLGLGACVAASQGRRQWTGLLAGLSFATKQTGLVWLPLALAIMLVQDCRPTRLPPRRPYPAVLNGMGRFIIRYLAPVVLVLAWDTVRVALGADSFWPAGVVGYGGLRLIWSHELWPRLRAWSQMTTYLFGSPLVNALLLAGSAVLVCVGLTRNPGTRRAFIDLLLVLFSMAYLLLNWLVAFPIWSRYLLPLVPVLAILLGRVARGAASFPCRRWKLGVRPVLSALLLALLLTAPALEASAGQFLLTEERAAYQGIDDVVAFLGQLSEGSVVYHHWLGWHYHYALFDAPVYLAYWPSPAWLARDVQAFGRRNPRYVVFPAWESAARVERALHGVGYRLDPVLTVARDDGGRSFIVYRIVSSPS